MSKQTLAKAPYSELDSNMVKLCRALNKFSGIYTISSCGGHENPASYQRPEGSWSVSFTVEHNEHGWRALEFITWVINNALARGGFQVHLSPYSPPPYLNEPGNALTFLIDGKGIDPDKCAEELIQLKREYYVLPPK